jgi:hypothetical protein
MAQTISLMEPARAQIRPKALAMSLADINLAFFDAQHRSGLDA